MKLGLCLSGGGIKGAAHIGAIKALEEENIEFDAIAGTSAGSIVAVMYACGYNSSEMYNFFQEYAKKIKYIDWKNIFTIILGVISKRQLIIRGLKSGEVIEKIVNKVCNEKGYYNINDIDKELLIPAVDSKTGKLFIFNSCGIDKENEYEKYIPSESIGNAVRASSSFPGMFIPCEYLDTELLDGGIKENVPWVELKAVNCDKILSIDFISDSTNKCCGGLIDIFGRSLELINEELTRHELNNIDFLHSIKLEKVSLLDITKIQELFEEGYKQTKEKMWKIKEYLKN